MPSHTQRALVLALALVAAAPALTRAEALAPAQPSASEIVAACQAARPGADELRLYDLDWVEGLPAAVARARRERRPLLVLVVRNISGGGNLFTGHC